MQTPAPTSTPVPLRAVAELLRIIGRGAHGSRALSTEQAQWLMQRMLHNELAAAQLGGILLALRMKGESADELLGFLQAVELDMPMLDLPSPVVVLASVNGARKLVNQVPLLALLLQRKGIPTLVIGQTNDDDRLPTARLWSAVGLPVADGADQAQALLRQGDPAYLDLAALSPGLSLLLAQRAVLGVRNVAHTLVKLLVPVRAPALLLYGHTHAEYGGLTQQVLTARGHTALLLHGCEGEAVPHPSRRTALLWANPPAAIETPHRLPQAATATADLPQSGTDLQASCDWTRAVACGRLPTPTALEHYATLVERTALALRQTGSSFPFR
ncbi:MAG: DNA-binding protein YbiB [Thiomonas sp.]